MYSLTISFVFERKKFSKSIKDNCWHGWFRRLTDKQRWQTICQLDVGRRQIDVAANFGVSLGVVGRLYQRYQQMGEVAERRGRGRTWAISRADDRYDVVESLRSRTLSAPNCVKVFKKRAV